MWKIDGLVEPGKRLRRCADGTYHMPLLVISLVRVATGVARLRSRRSEEYKELTVADLTLYNDGERLYFSSESRQKIQFALIACGFTTVEIERQDLVGGFECVLNG